MRRVSMFRKFDNERFEHGIFGLAMFASLLFSTILLFNVGKDWALTILFAAGAVFLGREVYKLARLHMTILSIGRCRRIERSEIP